MKSNFFPHLFKKIWVSLLVFLTYMIIDFLFYGLNDPGAYTVGLVDKSIWSLLLAFTFTIVYNSASNWRPMVDLGKFTGAKIINSIVFSFFISLMLIGAIALSGFFLTTVFTFLLDGIRALPAAPGDMGILAGKVIVGGLVTEMSGKSETDVPRI